MLILIEADQNVVDFDLVLERLRLNTFQTNLKYYNTLLKCLSSYYITSNRLVIIYYKWILIKNIVIILPKGWSTFHVKEG